MDATLFVDSFRDINKRFVKLVDALSALRALSSLEVENKDEASLLKFALRVLVENQDTDRCSVFLKQGDALVCAAGYAWDDGDPGNSGRTPGEMAADVPTLRLGEGIAGRAASTGELQHCRDCSGDERFAHRGRDSERDAPGSIVSVPIKCAGEILGVLNISHPQPHNFTVQDERMLQVYANFLGFMLANSRHTQRMQEEIKSRTQQLETALLQARELRDRYEQLSVVDELTALHNRRYFFPEARAVLARAGRTGEPTALMLIDIDQFKNINDTYGHAVGDQILRGIAEILREQTRESDIVARLGGDEFAVALPNTEMAEVDPMTDRIREAVRGESWVGQSTDPRVTVTIGVAVWQNEDTGPTDTEAVLDALLREADQALYQGKQEGRDRVRYYGRTVPRP